MGVVCWYAAADAGTHNSFRNKSRTRQQTIKVKRDETSRDRSEPNQHQLTNTYYIRAEYSGKVAVEIR